METKTKFEKFGTLLSREEAKKVKGGSRVYYCYCFGGAMWVASITSPQGVVEILYANCPNGGTCK